MLDPFFAYAETGGWPKTFAEHDLGSAIPTRTATTTAARRDMPVEESANMLIMTAAYSLTHDADAAAYATPHYRIFKQWADYLVANALDPVMQNQTDDFTGFIAHSANLALKGILAVGAMGADRRVRRAKARTPRTTMAPRRVHQRSGSDSRQDRR